MYCGSKVRYFIENLTVFFIPKSGRKYSHTNSYNFAMTLISQDNHLTAGAWAACVGRETEKKKMSCRLKYVCSL